MATGLYGIRGNKISFKSGAAFPGNSLLTRGTGACTMIEAKKTDSGYKLFHLEMHKKRLKTSAEFLGFDFEKVEGLRNLGQNLLGTKSKPGLLEKCGFDESCVRVYISDLTDDGFTPAGRPEIYVFIDEEHRHTKPAHVATTLNHHRAYPHVKTLSDYQPAEKAMSEAKADFGEQIEEVIYVNPHTGEVLEGGRSNIFILKKDYEFVTPDPRAGKVLPGITLQILMKLVSKKMYMTRGVIKIGELFSPDTTGIVKASTTGVVPICSINGREVPISQKTLEVCRGFEDYRTVYYANK